jgi:hypothetical protein
MDGGGQTPCLSDVVEQLSNVYGSEPEPFTADPFELIVWENVAYLAKDERRAEAMARLGETVGTAPKGVLRATPKRLSEAAELGILWPVADPCAEVSAGQPPRSDRR